MKIKKVRFNRIKVFFDKIPRVLGEKVFLTFLGFLIIFLIFGAFLFYKYIFLVEKIQPDVSERPLQFNEKLFQEILEKSEEKKQKLEETKIKEYPDPFTRTVLVEEELTE